MPRLTIARDAEIRGLGLHSGEPTILRMHPGEEGIWFRSGSERVPASPRNVTDTKRSTSLGSVRTVEHVMSALGGLGVTDIELELEGPEMPGVDGSSLPFCRAILEAGLTEVGSREFPLLFKRVFVQDGQASLGVSTGTGRWKFEYEAGSSWPRLQSFESDSLKDDYLAEIAPARTFALEEELPHLEKLGLGQGLDESSAVIVGTSGYLNEVRFGDEPARHKLLDAAGDLYLAQYPLHLLNVAAIRSGHTVHAAAAKKLADALEAESASGAV